MTSVHNLFQTLLTQWLASDIAPESPMEGVAPEFASLLAVRPAEFTFDSLIHTTEMPDWMWQSLEFDEIFDGQFFFYVPTTWSEVRQKGPQAIFGDATATRQSLFLIQKASWQPGMITFLEQVGVTAFAYYPLFRPNYHQWVFVTEANSAGSMWVYAAYSSGDWLVIVKGDAPTPSDLNNQLTSLINSNPWHGWIESAKARQRQ